MVYAGAGAVLGDRRGVNILEILKKPPTKAVAVDTGVSSFSQLQTKTVKRQSVTILSMDKPLPAAAAAASKIKPLVAFWRCEAPHERCQMR